ncbi:MAG: hypothetical protein GY928_34085 [Colwellia sp.]|nr:hypothetical protein [Colwellia sp.]
MNLTIATKQAVSGKLAFTVLDRDGNAVKVIKVNNRIPTIGLNMIARYFADDAGFPVDPLTHLAIGTNSTAAAAPDTALGTEVLRVLTTSQSATGDTATLTGLFLGGTVEGVDLYEFGIFNDPTAGEMLARVVLATPITLPVGFTLQVQWDIVFSYTQVDPKLVFTTLGLEAAADLLVGGATTAITDIGIGTGTTNPLPANTILETETNRASLDSITVAGGLVTHVVTFTGPLSNIAEQGCFNAGVGGTMFNRIAYDGVLNLPAGDTQLTSVTEFVYGGI